MAVSAFKSTSRRGTQTNPSPSFSSSSSRDQLSKEPVKKNPARRSRSVSAVQRSHGQLSQEEFQHGNTIDNPLFDCSSGSSKSSSNETERTGIGKGRTEVQARGRVGRGPVAVSQHSRERSLPRGNPARQRVRSVSRGPSSRCPSRSNESDYLSTDNEEGRIYETVRSEVQRAVSQIRDDLQNVIKGKNITEISSDLDGTTDIKTEYTTKLDQSQERIMKLRAELAFEEQKKEELNKVLKEVVFSSSPESSEGLLKTKPKRRTSIERREVSRRLEEEAMSYFEECVSISNFDGSDLSSLEDPLIETQKSRISNPLIGNKESETGFSNPLVETQESGIGIFLSHEEIAFAESLISNDERSFFEDSDNQTPRSIRTIGSDLALSCDNYGSDFNASSENFHFSFAEKSSVKSKTKKILNFFAKGINGEKMEREKNVRSRYSKEEYISKGENENLINERVAFRNKLQSGGILICDIRTF
ncbi:hypothetical protein LUZ60_010954 [Juncus effusus]|nr:hypothetical protein LUZ60_010954 [Juncus effusus]